MCVLFLFFCGSWLASDGGRTADQFLWVVRIPVGAAAGCDLLILLLKNQKIAAFGSSCLCVFQFWMFNGVSNSRKLPTMFSGCPSDVRSLACVRRCQISDRDWKPRREPSALALFMTYACAPLLCALRYGGCARETFGSTGFSVPRVSSLRTAATYSFGNRMGQLHFRIGDSP